MAVKNSLVAQANKQTFSAYLTQNAIKHKINQMVGGKDGQRFITSIISAVSVNPDLAECDYSTILSSAMLGESLKLSPSPQLGQYYMLPFNDKKRGMKVATFVLGYKGYLQLAIRSGYYKKINVLPIKEGELTNFDPLNEIISAMIIEDEEAREAAPTIGYYAFFEYHNGFIKPMYWSKKKMMIHADTHAPAFSAAKYRDLLDGKIPSNELWKYSSFWYKQFDDMAMKTMLRQLISKWGIMSIDLQTAYERDESMQFDDGSYEYVESVESEEESATPTVIEAEVIPPKDITPEEKPVASAENEMEGDAVDPFDSLFDAGA